MRVVVCPLHCKRWLWTFSRKLGGIRFFAVDYSLAPEAPFPIALKQALDSYLWLTDPDGGGTVCFFFSFSFVDTCGVIDRPELIINLIIG